MRKRTLTGLIFLFVLGFASPLWAQSGASVQYVYDALGRLTTVIDPSGNVATYNYDAVGNLLSITRTTTSPSALAIFGFSPAQGSVGQTVAIQGQNFSATPSANTVQFNGTAATVTAATANSLTVTVPASAGARWKLHRSAARAAPSGHRVQQGGCKMLTVRHPGTKW